MHVLHVIIRFRVQSQILDQARLFVIIVVLLLERIEDYIHEERRAYSMEEVDNSSRTGIPASLDVL